jgi:heme/copper-type cytochrome/quinol oxidase subunit 1
MDQKGIWIIFFTVLASLGFAVAVFPTQVVRLIGAPRRIQEKRGVLLVWRGLGGLVLIGAVVELVLLFAVGHVVK